MRKETEKKIKILKVNFENFDAEIDGIMSKSKIVKRSIDNSRYVDEQTLNRSYEKQSK